MKKNKVVSNIVSNVKNHPIVTLTESKKDNVWYFAERDDLTNRLFKLTANGFELIEGSKKDLKKQGLLNDIDLKYVDPVEIDPEDRIKYEKGEICTDKSSPFYNCSLQYKVLDFGKKLIFCPEGLSEQVNMMAAIMNDIHKLSFKIDTLPVKDRIKMKKAMIDIFLTGTAQIEVDDDKNLSADNGSFVTDGSEIVTQFSPDNKNWQDTYTHESIFIRLSCDGGKTWIHSWKIKDMMLPDKLDYHFESERISSMLDELRILRNSHLDGYRTIYNSVCDKLDILKSKLIHGL